MTARTSTTLSLIEHSDMGIEPFFQFSCNVCSREPLGNQVIGPGIFSLKKVHESVYDFPRVHGRVLFRDIVKIKHWHVFPLVHRVVKVEEKVPQMILRLDRIQVHLFDELAGMSTAVRAREIGRDEHDVVDQLVSDGWKLSWFNFFGEDVEQGPGGCTPLHEYAVWYDGLGRRT